MKKVRDFAIAMIIMIFISIIALLVVSTFTYLFKWQADKAMIGIIVTYILAGFAGGFYMRIIQKREYGKAQRMGIWEKAREALILSTIFMLILVLCSWLRLRISFELSSRFLLIWLLITSSSFAGMCVKR